MFQQDITAGPGTGTFASHSFEIIIMLLGAFLIGLWLGWVLWNRFKQAYDRLRVDYDALQTSVTSLTSEMGVLKTKVGALDKEREDLVTRLALSDNENTDLRSKIMELQAEVAALTTENRQLETEVSLNAGEAESIEENAGDTTAETPEVPETVNLTTITGDATVVDTEPDASSAVVELEVEAPAPAAEPPAPEVTIGTPVGHAEVLDQVTIHDDSNFRFVMQDTDEPEAFTAARSVAAPVYEHEPFSDDSFLSLTARNTAAPAVEAEAPVEAPVFVPLKQDDLKIIEGIGPKIEELLFKAGIHTYSELAAAPVQRLKEILEEAGPRFSLHDPGTWSAQALLAANGEWENLKAYQGFLDSGKAPTKK